jgi:dimethylhistidine N-methyltransferase/glutamate--cysteine ligase
MRDVRQSAQRAPNQTILAEVRDGLTREQKELSPKFFYDARGSRLFEDITRLEEYYLTRTERAMLEQLMPRWVREASPLALLELGAGSAEKSRIILNAMRATGSAVTYVPIDVSADFLQESARRLRQEYPELRVITAVADMTRELNLPRAMPRPALFAFLGSTIGNFEDDDAVALLARIAAGMQPGDRFLMGADLVKDRSVLEAAYNDARGVTAKFNLNILRVLKRELGAEFDEQDFRHQAFFNPVLSRVEMHLIANRRHGVAIPGMGEVTFREGESIRTEISRKFSRRALEELLGSAGLVIEKWATDERGWYALMTAGLAPVRRRARLMGQGRLVAPLREDLRANAFALGADQQSRPDLVGAEIELLALRADSLLPCPIDDAGVSSRGFLRRYGEPVGWIEEVSPKGTPRFRIPGRGTVSFEPGGQIEFSTAAAEPSAVLRVLREVVQPLRNRALENGIVLLDSGLDPYNDITTAAPQLFAERYARMARYFDSIGPAGIRMMRQTAAFHLNFDFGDQNMLRWRVLNAAAPFLTAMFANSRRYAGTDTGFASARAMTWRSLDPARTGILPAGPVAEDEYLDFALNAPAMLLESEPGRYPAFIERWTAGNVTMEDWHEHLTTLFPDVRPRGYLELRCIDAMPPAMYSAPIVLVSGLLYDRESLATANDLLGSPNRDLLPVAAAAGLSDDGIRGVARDLVAIGLSGARRLGASRVSENDLDEAARFFARYTLSGSSPGDFTPSGG